jgi:hypothetical protein
VSISSTALRYLGNDGVVRRSFLKNLCYHVSHENIGLQKEELFRIKLVERGPPNHFLTAAAKVAAYSQIVSEEQGFHPDVKHPGDR